MSIKPICAWLKQDTWPSAAATVALVVGSAMGAMLLIAKICEIAGGAW